MSTKIYEAYRVPNNRLNDFLKDIGDQMLDKVIERLDILMNNMKPETFYKLLLKQWNGEDKYAKKYFNDGKPARYTQLEAVLSCCREVAHSQARDVVLDIECGLSIRIRNKYAYIIPYGERAYARISIPNYAKEYTYWNNTDQPEDVSNAQWNARGKIWNEILDESPILTHTVVDLVHDFVNVSCKFQKKMKLGFWAPGQMCDGEK